MFFFILLSNKIFEYSNKFDARKPEPQVKIGLTVSRQDFGDLEFFFEEINTLVFLEYHNLFEKLRKS